MYLEKDKTTYNLGQGVLSTFSLQTSRSSVAIDKTNAMKSSKSLNQEQARGIFFSVFPFYFTSRF
jgi:hypothetical protein